MMVAFAAVALSPNPVKPAERLPGTELLLVSVEFAAVLVPVKETKPPVPLKPELGIPPKVVKLAVAALELSAKMTWPELPDIPKEPLLTKVPVPAVEVS